jgi:hypothetical protein
MIDLYGVRSSLQQQACTCNKKTQRLISYAESPRIRLFALDTSWKQETVLFEVEERAGAGLAQWLYYELDDWGFATRQGLGIFLFATRPDRLWGPPSLLYNGYQRLLPWGVKWPGREADPSPSCSAEVLS